MLLGYHGKKAHLGQDDLFSGPRLSQQGGSWDKLCVLTESSPFSHWCQLVHTQILVLNFSHSRAGKCVSNPCV